jgi:hypothetical protein
MPRTRTEHGEVLDCRELPFRRMLPTNSCQEEEEEEEDTGYFHDNMHRKNGERAKASRNRGRHGSRIDPVSISSCGTLEPTLGRLYVAIYPYVVYYVILCSWAFRTLRNRSINWFNLKGTKPILIRTKAPGKTLPDQAALRD